MRLAEPMNVVSTILLSISLGGSTDVVIADLHDARARRPGHRSNTHVPLAL